MLHSEEVEEGRGAGRQAQRVLPVKFDEGEEEEERRSSRRLRSDVSAFNH